MPAITGYPHRDTPDAFRAFAARWHSAQPPDPGWVVVRLSDGLAIGEIGFGFEAEPGVRTGGYGFAPAAWGQGYASEALSAVLPFVLGQPGVLRVVAEALKTNVASWRVMEKAGMTFVEEFQRAEGHQLRQFVSFRIDRQAQAT